MYCRYYSITDCPWDLVVDTVLKSKKLDIKELKESRDSNNATDIATIAQ